MTLPAEPAAQTAAVSGAVAAAFGRGSSPLGAGGEPIGTALALPLAKPPEHTDTELADSLAAAFGNPAPAPGTASRSLASVFDAF